MKYLVKLNYLFTALCMVFIPSKISASEYFSPIIKLGINGNYFSSPHNQYYDYSFPLGISFGISVDTKMTKGFFISNSIYYKNSNAKSYFEALSPFNPLKYNYNSIYIRYSPTIGFKIYNIIDLLIGYDVGRMMDLNIKIKGSEGLNEKFKAINPKKIDNAICIGIRRNIKLKEQDFKIEIKYLYGLTKYNYKSDYGTLPNSTRINDFELLIGYGLKL